MSARESIYIDGFAHKNPVPAACRMGNIIYSGGIHGMDPETGETPEDIETQCALMFSHVKTIVAAAGGSADDIVKLTLWMKNREDRPVVNPHWEEMFPDPDKRPARHAIQADLRPGMLIQCDFVAVLPEGAAGATEGHSSAL